MDLSNPLATVTPTLDAAVLQALSATTGMSTGAHVHRMAGTGSADGVRRVLARLVRQGIVVAEEHAHATLYRLNRDHLAAGPILELTRMRARIVEKIIGVVGCWSLSPVHASMFGSFARGGAGEDSDIDILLVTQTETETETETEAWASGDPEGRDPDTVWRGQVEQLASDVHRWTGNHAHIVEVSSQRLAAMIEADDPLVASWRGEEVHLMGDRLLDVMRTVRASAALPARGLR